MSNRRLGAGLSWQSDILCAAVEAGEAPATAATFASLKHANIAFLCGITMVAGTLYTYPENWRAFKGLRSGNSPHHLTSTLAKPTAPLNFSTSKVPVFEGDNGFCVFESNTIAYYVSNEDLRGSSPEAAVQVVQWRYIAPSQYLDVPSLDIMHYNK
ncbi:hypothetical protein QTO34_018172 [Cnephaeus nilssonii]|uniref:GST N-terminal domain-containing protein n=1 Tax=Cnephaeus nilssonii TaxID=3371016 RepID=A0AA40HYB4_CNENI|nr:hypothetical protein QTO34_018172 [Eptesicus nilssonii]